MITRFRQYPQGPRKQGEGGEVLRFVEHGHRVPMVPVSDDGIAVDIPDDLARTTTLHSRHPAAPPRLRPPTPLLITAAMPTPPARRPITSGWTTA